MLPCTRIPSGWLSRSYRNFSPYLSKSSRFWADGAVSKAFLIKNIKKINDCRTIFSQRPAWWRLYRSKPQTTSMIGSFLKTSGMNRLATSAETRTSTSMVHTCQSNGITMISTVFNDRPLETSTWPTWGGVVDNQQRSHPIWILDDRWDCSFSYIVDSVSSQLIFEPGYAVLWIWFNTVYNGVSRPTY